MLYLLKQAWLYMQFRVFMSINEIMGVELKNMKHGSLLKC